VTGRVPNESCAGCELGRRAFLRDAAAAAALALGLPAPLLAAAARATAGAGAGGATVAFPVPAHDGALVDRDHDVILVRWQNAVYAFALACPHQRVALRWLEKDGRFQCPKHKSKYRPDGAFIEGRATRGMDRFPVRREGESVIVETARLIKQTDDPPAWDAAVLRL
jgi:nitrite reductase/ring-hydroxylating ferredoxin subunit